MRRSHYLGGGRRGWREADGTVHLQEEPASVDPMLTSGGDRGPVVYRVNPYGFLEGLQVHIADEPNMNAADPIFVELRVWHHGGKRVHVEGVTALLRGIGANGEPID